MLETTNIIPIIGIKKLFEENILIAPINPPSEREPVSPINILALLVLNTKNAIILPINIASKILVLLYKLTKASLSEIKKLSEK